MKALRRHLTYANTMATVAVFIALGGGASAIGLVKGTDGKPVAHPALAVSLYPDTIRGDVVSAMEGARTARATCAAGQVVIGGSYTDQRGGFSGTPKVKIDYAQRQAVVDVTFGRFTSNGVPTASQIRAVADCIGAR